MESIEMVEAIHTSAGAKTAQPWLREYIKNELLHTPAFWPDSTPGVSAASVLESIKENLDGAFHHHFNPIIEWSRSMPPFSGNMLELHFNRNEAWFDFAYRISKEYDASLLKAALLPKIILPLLQDEQSEFFQKPMPCFRYGIENICIEYDFPFQSPPALFFDLHRDKEFDYEKVYADLKKLASVFQQPIYEELIDFFAKIKRAGLNVV